MSVLAILVFIVIAAIASALYSLVSGSWVWRSFAAMFVFALAILWLPSLIHP